MSFDKCNYLCIRYTVKIYSISSIKKCFLSTFLVSYLSLPEMQKTGLIPGSGRSPGEGNDNPCQYSCLENSMDTGAWWATVHGVQIIGHE